MTDAPDDVMLDLDALPEEPEREPFTFRFGGEVYTCRPPESFPVADLAEFIHKANENPAVMLEMWLDADQLARMEASEAVFDLGMLKKVREGYEKHYELDAPKASGSQRPSKRTKVR